MDLKQTISAPPAAITLTAGVIALGAAGKRQANVRHAVAYSSHDRYTHPVGIAHLLIPYNDTLGTLARTPAVSRTLLHSLLHQRNLCAKGA